MLLDVFFVVVVTSIIQSIFGVGVLLFGTPALLILGYDFIGSVIILLPISLVINFLQVSKDYKKINIKFYKRIILYSIPFIVFLLFIVAKFEVKIELVVGVFLLIIAMKESFPKLNHYLESLMKYEKLYLMITGVVHGATNLGGSMLTAMVYSKKHNKSVTRVTIAISYATFALFQLATLFFVFDKSKIDFIAIACYVFVGITAFLITETLVYMKISNQKYTKLFSMFLFVTGMLVCFKSL